MAERFTRKSDDGMSMQLPTQSDSQYFKPYPNMFSVVFTRLFLLVQRAATHRSVTGRRDRCAQALASCFTRRWKEWKSSSVRKAAAGNLAGRWNKTSEGSRETEERWRRDGGEAGERRRREGGEAEERGRRSGGEREEAGAAKALICCSVCLH